MHKVLFWRCLRLFLFVYEISWEPLNGFALSQIHGKRVLSLARTSLKFKVNFGGLRAVYVLEKNLCSSLYYYVSLNSHKTMQQQQQKGTKIKT